MKRIFKPFVFVLAAIYFVVDAAFWTIARPVIRLLGDHWIFESAANLDPVAAALSDAGAVHGACHYSRTRQAASSLSDGDGARRQRISGPWRRRAAQARSHRTAVQSLPRQADVDPGLRVGLREISAGAELGRIPRRMAADATFDAHRPAGRSRSISSKSKPRASGSAFPCSRADPADDPNRRPDRLPAISPFRDPQ